MYINKDGDNGLFELHDCVAEKIVFENNVLSFIFPKGFWVMPNHPKNTSQDTVHTDSAQVDFSLLHNINDVSCAIYRIAKTGKIEGKVYWEAEEFLKTVNAGKIKIEFLERFDAYKTILYKCGVHFDKQPFYCECEIILNVEKVEYLWNNLDYNRTF